MEYHPLDFATFEFRLLTIKRVATDEAADSIVHCNLYHSNLIDPPEYQALSYCWGDPTITKPIMIDGVVVYVTANLEAGLQQLRAVHISTLWIDALCINQADLVERGLQVMRMDRIFSKANGVIIWLGVDESDSEVAGLLCNRRLQRRRPSDISFTDSTVSSTSTGTTLSYQMFSRNRGPVLGIKYVLRRPFWRRVWIIQEIAKAQGLNILVGGGLISWQAFESLLNHVDRTELPLEIQALQKFRNEERSKRLPTLLDALQRSEYFESSDIRDKIYALLGLTIDGSELVPTPNYVQSPRTVYFQAIEQFVERSNSLSFLVKSRQRTHDDGGAVEPDWTNLKDGVSRWIFSILRHEASHNPSGSSYLFAISRRRLRDFTRSRGLLPYNTRWSSGGPHPYLSYYGLAARVKILDSISAIRGPFVKLRANRINKPKPTEEKISWREKRWTFVLDTKLNTAEDAKSWSLCSAVLYDIWIALTSNSPNSPYLYDGQQTEWRIAYSLTDLCIRSKWARFDQPVSVDQVFSNWLSENQNLMHCGKTLREWIKAYSLTTAYKKKYGETGASKQRFKRLMRDIFEMGPRSSQAYQKALLEAVSEASRDGLCLAIGSKNSVLGYVECEAMEGDLICVLKDATVPIVLRQDDHGYTFVCEAKFSVPEKSSQPEERWERRRYDYDKNINWSTSRRTTPRSRIYRRTPERRQNGSDTDSSTSSSLDDPRETRRRMRRGRGYEDETSGSPDRIMRRQSNSDNDNSNMSDLPKNMWESILIR
jgi:hypothetical protein